MPVSLEIVLPCYNPSDTWYNELLSFYHSAAGRYELKFVLVNDGSAGTKVEDDIQALRQKNVPIRYFSYQKNMGKGHALRTGIKQTSSDLVVYTDVDFPFTNESVMAVIEQLTGGQYDVVAGHREQDYYQENMSGFRKFLSKTFRFFLKKILKLAVTDTQCGLKGFNRKGKDLFLSTRINRYLFDFEFIYAACKKNGVRIGTVAVHLKENVVFSKMRLKILIEELFNLFYILIFK